MKMILLHLSRIILQSNPGKMKVGICYFMLFISGLLAAQKVEWISTTEKKPWVNEKNLKLDTTQEKQEFSLEIYQDEPLQTMTGFGGCFNEFGYEALKNISEDKQESIYKELFSPEGANFCLNRLPVGASDYSLSYYSFDETKNDFAMKDFSIERDKKGLIPYIKRAQRYSPDMKFFASPWCPPSWMKVNENYASTSSSKYNSLPVEQESVTGTTGFKMQKGYLESYALYFSKFLDAYHNEGIHIGALHVQNEVLAEQIFPSCIWQAQDLALFIGNYLGPRFEKDGRNVSIWLGTLNVGDFNYIQTAMKNPKAARYIKGIGFQWDGKNSITETHKVYPQMHLMQTENECGNGENNWKSAEHTWSLMKHYIGNGAEAYIYWNFILKTPGVSNWGWVQNSMVTISEKTGAVIYTPEFYVMKHFSHFVMPGATLLRVSDSRNVLAFKNPNGKIIVVWANQSDTELIQTLKIAGNYLNVTLKANSFNTFEF